MRSAYPFPASNELRSGSIEPNTFRSEYWSAARIATPTFRPVRAMCAHRSGCFPNGTWHSSTTTRIPTRPGSGVNPASSCSTL